MKNRIIKLLMIMLITVAGNLLITGVMHLLGIQVWGRVATLITSFILCFIIAVYVYRLPSNSFVTVLIGIVVTAVGMVGNEWLYYSANETVPLANIKELLALPRKPLYFTLKEYKYDIYKEGTVREQIKATRKRGRLLNAPDRTYQYTVIPLYADSSREEAKVWIATKYDLQKGKRFSIKPDPDQILNFQLLTTETGNYRKAVAYSSHPRKTAHPLFITPLYKPYIKQSTWGLYFLISLAIGVVIMVLTGCILNGLESE